MGPQESEKKFLDIAAEMAPRIDVLLKIYSILAVTSLDCEEVKVVHNKIQQLSLDVIHKLAESCDCQKREVNPEITASQSINCEQVVVSSEPKPITTSLCKMCKRESNTLKKPTPNVRRYLKSINSEYASMSLCRDCRISLASSGIPSKKANKKIHAIHVPLSQDIDFDLQNDVGLLGVHGYRVGKSGILAQNERIKILNKIFMENKSISCGFRLEGGPNSKPRFKQIERAITFQINSKEGRTDRDFDLAVGHWTSDLKAFKKSHHV